VNANQGKKRLSKAIERSANWFQSLVTSSGAAGVDFTGTHDTHAKAFLFGVAQFDKSYPIQLPLLVKHMLEQGAKGIVIGNAHMGEDKEQREECVSVIKALLPPAVPTLIQGADSLAEVRWLRVVIKSPVIMN
jgi:queuine/archaeosine tRNA-ribosyltransferase